MAEVTGKDVRNIIEMLDDFASSNTGRMKLTMADDIENATMKKEYHHGRCDVGSPWACENGMDALDKED